MAQTLFDAVFKVNTQELDNANAKVKDLGQSADKTSGSADGTSASFTKMGAAAGVVAAAFIAASVNAIKFADSMNDVAKANDVAVGTVLKLSSALMLSGGESDSVGRLFSSFTSKIYDAAEGSETTRESFAKLGITLKDLGTLTETQLLEKALRAFADPSMGDAITRNAIATDLFGKAAKGVDLKGVSDSYFNNKGNFEEAEKAFNDIGEALDIMDAAGARVSTTLATTLGPAVLASVKFIDDAVFGWDKLSRAIDKAAKARDDYDLKWKAAPKIGDEAKAGDFNLPEEFRADRTLREVKPEKVDKPKGTDPNSGVNSLISGMERELGVLNNFTRVQLVALELEDKRYANIDKGLRASALKQAALIDEATASKKLADENKRLAEEATSAGNSLIEGLDRQLLSQQTLNKEQLITIELNDKKYKLVDEGIKQQALLKASQIDTSNAQKVINDSLRDSTEIVNDYVLVIDNEINNRYKLKAQIDLENVVRQLELNTLDKIRRLREEGNYTIERELELREEQEKAVDKVTEAQERQKKATDDWITNGIDGYIKSLGTLEENLEKIATKGLQDFGDSLYSLITTGKGGFKEMVASMLEDIAKLIFQLTVVVPIMNQVKESFGGSFGGAGGSGLDFGSVLGFFGFANGGAFEGGTQMFADGGIVNRPTMFGMSNGNRGVMGEAGPEAILPLSRGAGGKLGVQLSGGAGGNQVVNNNNYNVIIQNPRDPNETARVVTEQIKQMQTVADQRIAVQLKSGGLLNRTSPEAF